MEPLNQGAMMTTEAEREAAAYSLADRTTATMEREIVRIVGKTAAPGVLSALHGATYSAVKDALMDAFCAGVDAANTERPAAILKARIVDAVSQYLVSDEDGGPPEWLNGDDAAEAVTDFETQAEAAAIRAGGDRALQASALEALCEDAWDARREAMS